ncbi:MAG: hypothetical protein WBP51_11305 [Candidatus Sulfotelmatobacter sp.]
MPPTSATVGQLQRRHVLIDYVKYVGKESNNLEEVDAGLLHSAENVYTEYHDQRRDEWQTKILPSLRKTPWRLLKNSAECPAGCLFTRVQVSEGRTPRIRSASQPYSEDPESYKVAVDSRPRLWDHHQRRVITKAEIEAKSDEFGIQHQAAQAQRQIR